MLNKKTYLLDKYCYGQVFYLLSKYLVFDVNYCRNNNENSCE